MNTSDFDPVNTPQTEIEIAHEDDKENFALEKSLKINQNTTGIKLFTTTTNNLSNSIKQTENTNVNNKLKDDKNNNNLSLLSDQQTETASLSHIVTEINSFEQSKSNVNIASSYTSQSETSRKTSSGCLENLIDVTSFTITTSTKLPNENIDSAN